MDKIRTELRNLRCVPLVHLYNSDYEWWNTITDTEERKTYITFYYKFCDTLDNIKNKLHYEYNEKEKELISKLVLDFAPYRKKRNLIQCQMMPCQPVCQPSFCCIIPSSS
jgi:hypothetical protein